MSTLFDTPDSIFILEPIVPPTVLAEEVFTLALTSSENFIIEEEEEVLVEEIVEWWCNFFPSDDSRSS